MAVFIIYEQFVYTPIASAYSVYKMIAKAWFTIVIVMYE